MIERSLRKLYEQHQGKVSDKWSIYLTEYDRIFSSYRERPINLLEIGIQNGGSLEVWSAFFANAQTIVGVDVNPDCARLSYSDPRISVIVGDANSYHAESALLEKSNNFDLIIDDGSHKSGDIVRSFSRYFRYLNDGGIYVVEDLHCSYWQDFEGGLFDPASSIAFFKRLADVLSHEHWGVPKARKDILRSFAIAYSFDMDEDLLEHIHSVEFINSMCVVRKNNPSENVLGVRFIAGMEELVVPGHGQLHLHPSSKRDELTNPWSARAHLPEDEFKAIDEELNDLRPLYLSLKERSHVDAARVADLQNLCRDHAARLVELEVALALSRRDFSTQLDQLTVSYEAKISESISAIAERNAENADLRSKFLDLEKALVESGRVIDSFYDSSSWRITGPLRAVARGARRMLFPFGFIASALRRGEGLSGTVNKAWALYKRDGLSGIRHGLKVVAQAQHVPPTGAVGSTHVDLSAIAGHIFEEQQSEHTRDELKNYATEFKITPLISVVMPVYKTPVKWLAKVIESLQDQVYENWELCVVDDCSPTNAQRLLLEEYSKKDGRVRYHFSSENQGISAASNHALNMARGEYIALIDHDDEITPDAFYWVVKTINEQPDVDFMYSDECKIDDTPARNLFHFVFKPQWSPELLFNGMLTGHLTVYRTEIVRRLNGFRSEYDFSQDYDLALRVSEIARNIVHIERILYLWRAIPGSAASGGKDYARESNVAALDDFLKRQGISAKVHALSHANYADVHVPEDVKVSIIIPSDSYDNLKLAIATVMEKTDYSCYEIVAVCNSPLAEKLAREFRDSNRVVFSSYDKKYNFSDKCNQGAIAASGEIIIFYNDDVFPIGRDWVEKLIQYLYVPGVGGTSPKLLHEDRTIQYAGMISGTPGLCGTAYNRVPEDENDAFLSMHKYVRNVSILSGACCALKKKVFLEINGFDAVNTPDGHSDMDLSFKLLAAGYRCVYTPYALLFHIGNHSWGAKKEKYKADIFALKRWGAYVSGDRYFTDSMKRVLYTDFRFDYKIFADQVDCSKDYSGKDILFLSHELSLTGAPRMLFYAAKAAQKNGNFVVVVAPKDGPMRQEFERAGIPVIIDETMVSGHFLFEGFAKNFDVVVANTIALHGIVERLSHIDNLQTIWWLHEAKALQSSLKSYGGSIDVSRVRLLCVSEYARSFVPAKYKVNVLYNGIPDVAPCIQSKVSRKNFVFLLAGTIEPRKGQDIFVDAILLLPEDVRHSSRFLIAGKLWDMHAPYWAMIEEKAKAVKEIVYLGLLEHQQVLEELMNSDMVVCASRDEPSSLIVAEAAALGKATILNKNVGVSSVFDDGQSCLLFEVGNAESLASRMAFAFNHQQEVNGLGQMARDVYERELSIEKFSEKFLTYINA